MTHDFERSIKMRALPPRAFLSLLVVGACLAIFTGEGEATTKPESPLLSSGGDRGKLGGTADGASTDSDGDGVSDSADADDDNDAAADLNDNCPLFPNPTQSDFDRDRMGDECDDDLDGDKVLDGRDECPMTAPGAVVDGKGCSSEKARR